MKRKETRTGQQVSVEDALKELLSMEFEIVTIKKMLASVNNRATRLREGLGGATLQAPPPSIAPEKMGKILARRTKTQLGRVAR